MLRLPTLAAGLLTAGFVAAVSLAAGSPLRAAVESSTFGGLEARAIGPAVMGGRIAALDAVRPEGENLTIYVGAAGGGVWKSDDGGLVFEPVFDDFIQSIGAIRIDPSDSQTVWVGTGESWVRNSVSIGDGVYRSTDGGETWEHRGLADSERIARIHVDPATPDRVFVCATGHLWDANEQRGVFRTEDGGETWEHVLRVDADTGCADLAMDPQDPDVLYAGMWQFRRTPWSFTSGGPGSGLYRSLDGGDSWHELTEGLPSGDKGRIAVAVAPSRPSRVYAVVEAEETALYRSDDLGASWTRGNDTMAVSLRPFYFAYLVVDPADYERVYKPGLFFAYSVDGGETFAGGGAMHSDLHALWANPADPREILVGTDGGLYHSYDHGLTFCHAQALPISQYYEVAADDRFPYNVYGGLQDNGSWMGPSRASAGIRGSDWTNIGFGDGFHVYPDPGDQDQVFVQYQGGQLLRYRRETGEIKTIKPYPGDDDPDYRCNWNTAMHTGASGRVYAGCQFLFRTEDSGESWRRISPDLTTDDEEKQQQHTSGGLTIDNSTAENHTTIFTISESPLDAEVIWVGTDDGNLQLTEDGGATWREVTSNVAGVPPRTWVSHVATSSHRRETAFVTFDGHRLGDMATYVYRTDDLGASWTALASPAEPETAEDPAANAQQAAAEDSSATEERRASSIVADRLQGFAHVVVQDPVAEDLLFVGTELGLFASLDGGATWARFESGLPPVSVRDLDIHPREHDLVIATHGRGVYIVDDLTPLRALRPEHLEEKLVPLPSRPSVQVASGQVQIFPGADEWVGETLPEAATLYYHQDRRHIFGDLFVEILDADGELVDRVPGGKRKGMNRVEWAMRLPPPTLPPATTLTRAVFGPRVPEGTYTYRIVKGRDTFDGTFEIVADPRSPYSREDRALQQRTAESLYDSLEELTYLVDAATALRDDARGAADSARGRARRDLESLASELESWRSAVVSTGEGGMLSGEERLREHLGELFGAVAGFDGPPTDSQVERAAVLAGQVERAARGFRSISESARLRRLSGTSGVDLEVLPRETWAERRERGGSGAGVWLGFPTLQPLDLR